MTMETNYTFVCDRDAYTTPAQVSSTPPVGWTRLTMQETPAEAPPMGMPPPGMGGTTVFLCPACSTAFKTFLTPPATRKA
jgi:hypothetical protein